VLDDRFYFIMFFPIDKIWGWFSIIRTMYLRFKVGCKFRGMKHRVNLPSCQELELEGYGGQDFYDLKWSVTFRGKFLGELCKEMVG